MDKAEGEDVICYTGTGIVGANGWGVVIAGSAFKVKVSRRWSFQEGKVKGEREFDDF